MDPNGKRPSGAGRSIIETLVGLLDAVIAKLATAPDDVLRGQAHAYSVAIATMRNPYAPPIDDVKAEARARWKARQ